MSKPTRAGRKRKALAANLLAADADTSSGRNPQGIPDPKDLAATMLGWLPADATLKSSDSQKILKAFHLLNAELQHRTNLMAKSSVETGKRSDVTFSGISIAPDVFRHVLQFLPNYEIVYTASLVSKAWLSAARTPLLWHTLDNEHGLLCQSSTVTNMTQLLKLLACPQFASVKTLVPPDKVRMRAKALEQIAKACPLLESIDLGYSIWSIMKIENKDLMSLPSLFPHLKHIQLCTAKVSDSGIAAFCERMGDRLLSIRIDELFYSEYMRLSNHTLASVIARHCRNLERFDFTDHPNSNISEKGIIALLNDCRKLNQLSLILRNTDTIRVAAFQHIAETKCVILDRLYVVGHSELMHDGALCAALSEKIGACEVISGSQHSRRINAARVAKRIHTNW
jgi:hypothetical protein